MSEPARRVLIDLDLDEQRGDIVIMDSLLVHKAPGVRELIENGGRYAGPEAIIRPRGRRQAPARAG